MKRYQVFISGTKRDQEDERREAMMALLAADAIPAGMELFTASDDDQWTYIERAIEECDYFVLIVAGRYGSLSADKRSYTEREYDHAVKKGIPVMTFVKKWETILSHNVDDKERIEAFRAKVMAHKVCNEFSNHQELGLWVTRAFEREKRLRPRDGWVRGNEALTTEIREELARLTRENQGLREKLAAAVAAPPPGAEELAQLEDAVMLTYSQHSSNVKIQLKTTWAQVFEVFGEQLHGGGANAGGLTHALGALRPRGATYVEERDCIRLLIHFQALGLVEHNNDRLWSLTRRGREQLMAQVPVRRPTK